MKLTIFTPAYNREKTLTRLYESLLRQSCLDFEWLIVDDGSSDATAELVKGFTGEGLFPVRYFYKENGGKHTAHNFALQKAEGDWFLCVDSDDLLADNAVELLLTLSGEKFGIIAYKEDMNGKRLSDEFPVEKSTLWELNEEYNCRGEFTLAFRTEYARRYPFPVFSGERFVGECVVYDQMDEPFRLLSQTLTICEYQPDGLTGNIVSTMLKNPTGYKIYYKQRIDMAYSLRERFGYAIRYNAFKILSKNEQFNYDGKHKILVFLTRPVGWLLTKYYHHKQKAM